MTKTGIDKDSEGEEIWHNLPNREDCDEPGKEQHTEDGISRGREHRSDVGRIDRIIDKESDEVENRRTGNYARHPRPRRQDSKYSIICLA